MGCKSYVQHGRLAQLLLRPEVYQLARIWLSGAGCQELMEVSRLRREDDRPRATE